ncbi:hypothetical protein [Brevibacillus laterosporus]|uniref:hypothetical protein n=1 Tax=Brevibacillus laterosporus TaxID=1465 RepID=UPI003B97F4B2
MLLCILFKPDLPHLFNIKGITFVTYVGLDHFLLACITNELVENGDTNGLFPIADNAAMRVVFHMGHLPFR